MQKSKVDYKKYLNKGNIILQIGSYDGVECEQEYGLRKDILNGEYISHLVEPLPDKFELLKQNYSFSKGLNFYYNLAIYNKNGVEKFFCNTTESSFVRHTNCNFINVITKTLDKFLNDSFIDNIDGLFLDVEGVEDIIIKDLFLKTNIRPKIIRYEFPHLINENELISFIENNNYSVFNCFYTDGDRVCVKKTLL